MEIMATTTNNHNQKELRLYVPNEQQTANSTALASGARSPFQREVREWQRIDPDTGALLTGRLEADRWINGPLNKYGKISDSQNISQPNGTQQTQRKQLEVLQTCTAAGGALQVIRQTTSSRWSTSSASASPLLLSANTSPIPQQQTNRNHSKHNFKQKPHNSNTTQAKDISSSPPPFLATTLLTNGFNHKPHHQQHHKDQHHFEQLQQPSQVKSQPYSLVNGISNRNRNWPDLTENMSTLDICDNEHDNEHDHDNDYIVEQQHSSDEQHSDDNDNDHENDHDDDSLNEDNDHQYLLNKRNNLKYVDFTKRHSFTVFANNHDHHSHNSNSNNNDHDSHHHQHHHNNHSSDHNLSRDSSSGSCSNNNQLFLLDTAPSLKLSNLMKSSSSLSNSSNNSTTASQATTMTTTTAATNPKSMNTHKSMATNKISLHAIVGSSSSGNNNTTTSSTPSPTTTTRPSWQQPTLYRQNSHNNSSNNTNLMKSRVGDNSNNCCSSSNHSSSSDESRSYAGKAETDLCHLQQQHRQSSPNQHHQLQPQQQQQIHFKQNDRLTPTHLPHSYHRVDLESFRHYNNNDNTTNNKNNYNNNDTDDDGLRLSSRHLRRQQIPNESSVNSLQRSRSISTDDLSTEWDIQGVDSEEPAEWRRVSKLRRSFQSSTKTNQSFSSPIATRRPPLDLPTNSVSVSKIRAELENGRRLNTVMRNNHVDLAALSSILNGSGDKETKSPLTPKRSSFLTAESLKEIRGKLKKLSDESLYKEDFLINQQIHNDTNPIVEHIVDDQTKIKRNYDKSPERYKVTNKTEEVNNKHTTNSLESRLKYRDTNSTDWHIRRKSYGFEKMSPPEKAMLRMDASTDSGLGRSGELQNWSPTSEAAATNRTVVHFGETSKITAARAAAVAPTVQRRYKPQKSYEESENSPEEDLAVSKRHSIAVDESQYVRDNSRQTTQVRINGSYEPGNYSKLMHTSESTTTNDRGQQKRVEFSKTEVHFATESGRVNIVETDSKPPPTNNFRRRRSRSSNVGPLQSLVKSATTVSTTSSVNTISNTSSIPAGVAMPVTLFGDDSSKKKTLTSTTVAYRAPLVSSPEPKDTGINVTVTIPTHNELFAYNESSRSSYASTSGLDTTDCDTDEMTSLRGILKNKPAKPKPYVLGENIDKPDDLWGVQLKPVSNPTKTERVYKSESPTLLSTLTQKSVAERIQELGTSSSAQTNGFSTKINVSLGSDTAASNNWEETDLPKSNVMSIKLHSPLAANEVQPPLKIVPPKAKPRTVTSIQETQPPKLHTATTIKQASTYQTSLPTKDSLKIIKEARGARQLRDHELSYFGVPQSTSEDENPKSKYTTNSNFRNSPKRSLPLRKLSKETSISMESAQREQWHLENDKPDLLKHNPIELKPAARTSLKKKAELEEDEEHLYENIANDIMPVFKLKAGTAPEQYDRKMDLKRDAMILSEMNKNADQTLRDISNEAALKDRRRRSLQRRNSKPLETIDEKSMAERINDTCIAVKISRGTYSSEAKKTSRQSTPSPTTIKAASRERTSSQSSVECCARARSRSLSSEKEYDIAKAKPSRTTQMVRHKLQKPLQSRSSSLESQRSAHSQYSSGEEQQPTRTTGSFRREDRSRTKTKRITSSASTGTRDKVLKQTSQQQHQHHGDSKRLSSTTHSSTHRERVECKHDNANGSSTTQPHRHHSSSTGLQRSTVASSSGRRQREDVRDSPRIKPSSATASGRSTNERHDKHDSTSNKHATRSVRDDERNSSQRSSSHRLERGDKEKEKSSRSAKGHSSRSTSHHHHERSTNPEKHTTTKDSKTKSTNTENTTYVSVTSLSHSQNEQKNDNLHTKHESNCKGTSETQIYSDIAETQQTNEKIPPPKPPRKKRKQSLIPIAIPCKPEREPPLPPLPPLLPTLLNFQNPASESPTYEYKIITKNIPPSYSNQSTLKKSSLPRPTSRLAMLAKAKKPSLKHTHSTSSSFAFLPYLPAKRNSDVSNVYDNYMLYAVPAAVNTKAYKQNLVNDHAQLFGSSGNRYHTSYGGAGGHGMKRRTVRSSVSTHQPFGICTCS